MSGRCLTLCIFLLALCGQALGAPAGVDALVQQARAEGLSQARPWRALLFYVPRWLRADDSVVDDPGFYLAPAGRRSAAAELEATLRAFFAPVRPGEDDAHALCRYPARRAWLATVLPLADAGLPTPRCRLLERWLERYDVHSATLVFASYFLNNPASLFGHTFLRLHRVPETPGGPQPPAMLDYAVNFAANPTADNPFLYAYLGLTGGFPGTFSLMPYYLKVQEYNNAESRDLWEYDLAFDPEETRRLLQVLWEIGPHSISYYYIDGNCSFVMLLLLDAVRPQLRLAEKFHLLVTPADTVRAVVAARDLVREVRWRPSSFARWRQREAELTGEERETIKALFDAEDRGAAPPELPALPPTRRARVLDAALDWIDYKEQLAGARQAVRYKTLQDRLLAQRAALHEEDGLAEAPPPAARPDLGPPSTMLAASGGRDFRARAFADLTWRPTLHDLASPSLGYSDTLQIEMLRVTVRQLLAERRARLQSLHLFDALSLPSVQPMLTPLAWRLGIGVEREDFGGERLRRDVEGGGGLAWAPLGGPMTVFGLGLVQAGWSAGFAGRWFVEPAALFGALLSPSPVWRLAATWRPSRTFAPGEQRQDHRLRVTAAWLAATKVELSLYGESWNGASEVGGAAAVFF